MKFLFHKFLLTILLITKSLESVTLLCYARSHFGKIKNSPPLLFPKLRGETIFLLYPIYLKRKPSCYIHTKGGKLVSGRNTQVRKEKRNITLCRLQCLKGDNSTNEKDHNIRKENENDDEGGIRILKCLKGKGMFVSTPVYYANDKPHIGHAYCNVLSDIITRFEHLKNEESKKKLIFFSGMDEHGLKIELKSRQMHIDRNTHVSSIGSYYKKMNAQLNVKVNLYYRTSNKFHKSFVQNVWVYFLKNNYIYKDVYKGYYDINEERYLSEIELKKKTDIKNVVYIEEENSYFFNILKWKNFLIDFYEKNEHFLFPAYLRNEIMFSLKKDLKNICISRYNTEWGIKIPGEEKGTIYVWFDALLSYISSLLYAIKKGKGKNGEDIQYPSYNEISNPSCSPCSGEQANGGGHKRDTDDSLLCTYEDILSLTRIASSTANTAAMSTATNSKADFLERDEQDGIYPSGYPSQTEKMGCSAVGSIDEQGRLFELAWNPLVQVIGRDILKFHGIFYIALLKSLNIKLPEKILCHGLVKKENIKMSKSLNNIVSPFPLLSKYNADVIRLYFVGSANIYEDKNFKEENVKTFELFVRNNVGNLLHRAVSLCLENNYNIICKVNMTNMPDTSTLRECIYKEKQKLVNLISNMEYPLFLEKIMMLIKRVNKFFVHNEPWNFVQNKVRFNSILYETFEGIKFFSVFMYPIMPQICLSILKNIGFENVSETGNVSLSMLENATDAFVLHELIKIV
ncbi:methionine--tRNA ligase, putative [Plasmodium ovale wallikeri]|uniref:methionine--tRNA ligase n=2 Tax=Plasmodium ovale TaxID=36330 RepID=A0A1A8YR72_PLAOA|nr:methionine--tRNA ligase, putative [Plasmodium ovale wallikeri]SBT34432.1 methionine--tRNA ligase, putative [Plasmodium ovale wallikeri]SBT76606.1 methionine--tRNA ligase, putative [Plasmodium ovale]